MRIGDTIDASLLQYDPSPYLRAQSNATASIGAGMTGLIDKFSEQIEETKQFKDEVKSAKEFGKALSTLDPKLAPVLDKYLADFDNPDASPRQLAIQARQMPAIVEAFFNKQATDRGFEFKERAMALDEQAQNFSQAREGAEWQRDEDAYREQEETRALAAPAILGSVIERTKSYEEQGVSLPFGQDQLQSILQTGTPQQKLQIAALAESYLPQAKEPTLRDIKFTNAQGQASEGTAQLVQGPNGPEWRIVPVAEAGSFAPVQASQLPAGLRDYADDFNRAGQANGIDPRFLAAVAMHETGGGTSPALKKKNNAMGISDDNGPVAQPSVGASIDRQARSLARPGGHYDGRNTIADIAGKYAPPKGATNDPRGLNKHWPDGVAKYYEALGGNPKGSVRAGAVTGSAAPKTEAELQKEQLEIQKLKGDVAGQSATREAETKKQAEAQQKTRRLLDTINEYAYVDQSTGKLTYNKRLDDAVGFGGGVGKQINRAIDGRTLADQQQLERFVESDLLEATKDLKPVSEDEMKLLMSRRPKIGDKPEAWAAYMDEIRRFVAEKTAETKSPAASYSDRLRGIK